MCVCFCKKDTYLLCSLSCLCFIIIIIIIMCFPQFVYFVCLFFICDSHGKAECTKKCIQLHPLLFGVFCVFCVLCFHLMNKWMCFIIIICWRTGAKKNLTGFKPIFFWTRVGYCFFIVFLFFNGKCYLCENMCVRICATSL